MHDDDPVAPPVGDRWYTSSKLVQPFLTFTGCSWRNMSRMVVIGRGEGEVLHTAHERQQQPESQTRYADRDVVMSIAHRIADNNAELMRRLA